MEVKQRRKKSKSEAKESKDEEGQRFSGRDGTGSDAPDIACNSNSSIDQAVNDSKGDGDAESDPATRAATGYDSQGSEKKVDTDSMEDAAEKKPKRIFATEEEQQAYLAKLERRRKKKKKKEKLKRKQMEEFEKSFAAKRSFPGAASVESFRSDQSRSNIGQKGAAPMVTWEKMTVGRLLQKIWMDPLIQRAWAMEDKSPQLEAPLGYIMNEMDRISEQGFQPSNEDILFARKRTSGVNLLDFEMYGAKFLLIDVGGQRTERKKWLAHFDIVDAVIFVVGLDQYDQVMMEDGVTNRLRDSLELFEEMCSSPWFRNSSFLLFLNKSDVFKTKIKQVPLTVCFRNYQGDPHDYDLTSKYIIKRFQSIHQTHASRYRDAQPPHRRRNRGHSQHATPHVYPYMTNATDTESMRFVIDTCQDILLRSEMAQWGFFDF